MHSKVLCDGCGNKFFVPEDYPRSRIQCPDCGVMCEVPVRNQARAQKRPTSTLTPPPKPRAPRPPSGVRPAPEGRRSGVRKARNNGDGDGLFGVAGERAVPCPGCHRDLPKKAVVCPACGFDQRIGRKTSKTFEPIYKQWETGLSLGKRLRAFILTQLVIQPLMISGLINPELPWGGDAFRLAFPALFGSIMLLLLLGTFDRTTIYRNSHGDVHLSKLWRVAFIKMPLHEIRLDQYDRVRLNVGKGPDAGDWLLLVGLFAFFIVPGIIWYYTVILQTGYEVKLGSIGKLDDENLYRGTDLKRAEQIGKSVADMTGMRFEGL